MKRQYFSAEEYWDSSTEAGPAKREATPFEEKPPRLTLLSFDAADVQFPSS